MTSDRDGEGGRRDVTLINKNVMVGDRRTSVRLEDEMWGDLRDVCRREGKTMQALCTMISSHKPIGRSLTSAIRVFLIHYYRSAATEQGHDQAGHGEHYIITNRISAERLDRSSR